MSYYWFNRKKILKDVWEKYHNKGGKEKTAKYYAANKEVLTEDARNKYRSLTEKQESIKRKKYYMNTDLNEKLNQYQRNYYS